MPAPEWLTKSPDDSPHLPRRAVDRPSSISQLRKAAIIFVVALLAEGVNYAATGRLKSNAFNAGAFVGGAFSYTLFAMIFATFIRGFAGVVTGVLVVLFIATIIGRGEYQKLMPERNLSDAIDSHGKMLTEAANSSFNKTGHIDVPSSVVRDYLGDISKKSEDLDPVTASATAGIVKVTSDMVVPSEEGRRLMAEINTEQFMMPKYIKTRADLEYRIKRVAEFRASAVDLLDQITEVELHIKIELAKRGIPPLKAKTMTDAYMQSVHLHTTLPVCQSNIGYADTLLAKFSMLKEQFGAWNVKDDVIYFNSTSALKRWNDETRRIIQIMEQRSAWEKQALDQRKRETN